MRGQGRRAEKRARKQRHGRRTRAVAPAGDAHGAVEPTGAPRSAQACKKLSARLQDQVRPLLPALLLQAAAIALLAVLFRPEGAWSALAGANEAGAARGRLSKEHATTSEGTRLMNHQTRAQYTRPLHTQPLAAAARGLLRCGSF